jgi:Patatin-like phospholipase
LFVRYAPQKRLFKARVRLSALCQWATSDPENANLARLSKEFQEFRLMAAPRIGLALGSGSARGWSHIGIIESLAEAGIEADIVCGTSMGSLVGAAYVAGHLTELRQWAETATWREIVRLMDVRLCPVAD